MTTPERWTDEFFSGLILETQRRLYSDAMTRGEADFLQEVLKPTPGARIVDVPCGNGRVTIALATHGYTMTGVDGSRELLNDARGAADEKNLNITFAHHDMRQLPWLEEFDHAFCVGNSFAYFDDTGNQAFLQAVRKILKPGGTFLLETHLVAETILTQPLQKRWFPFGDLYFLHDPSYDPLTTQLTSNYTLIQNGRVEVKQAIYQVYTCRQLLQMFADAGFRNMQTYGSLSTEPFRLGSSGLWILADCI